VGREAEAVDSSHVSGNHPASQMIRRNEAESSQVSSGTRMRTCVAVSFRNLQFFFFEARLQRNTVLSSFDVLSSQKEIQRPSAPFLSFYMIFSSHPGFVLMRKQT